MEDEKGSPSTSYTNLRPKKPRSFDEMDGALWDCSVCTYKNNAEAFKCAICDTRKGTSTRKPKVNSQLVAQQTAQQVLPTPPKIQKMSVPRKNNGSNKRGNFTYSRLKNVDQDSERQMEVTVGDVTVIITDYKLLPVKDEKTPPESPGQLEPTATTITTATTEATPTTTPAESTETKLEQINGDTPAHPPLESKKTEVGETSEHESSEVTSS